MNAFTIIRPKSFREAALDHSRRADTSLPMFKAGGMDVVDHLKEGLIAPDALIDVRRLASNGAAANIREEGGRVVIEARTTLSEIADSPIVRRHARALSQSAGSAATPQVRNVASLAGNLLQRPRCWYYRNQQFNCLKKGGNTCFAVEGENKFHAIFGGGPCHIVHPSNAAVALYVHDAEVTFIGPDEQRDGSIKIADLYNDGRDWVTREHTLEPSSVITTIALRPAAHSGFYAVKEKQSFDWPLVMVAATLEMDGDTISAARVCAGGVAPWPWPLPEVERALVGQRVDREDALHGACAAAANDGKPMRDNAYKLKLLPVAVRRAVIAAAADADQS